MLKHASYCHCTSRHRKASSSSTFQELYCLLLLPQHANQGKSDHFQTSPSAPWLPRFTLAVLLRGRVKFAHCNAEGIAWQFLPTAPCLLGISHASPERLEAVMLLNIAISKSELKYTKSALRGRFLFFFFFKTSGKVSKEHSEEAASKLATLQAKQPSLLAHCSLPATSDYWLQSKKLFSP